MPSRLPVIQLSTRDQEEIGRWLTSHGTPQQVALRSRIVLAAAAGRSDSAVAQELEINRKTVMWRRRFAQEGIDSLWEVAPGRGRKPTFGPDKIEAIVNATLQAKPKGMTQWSCRLMAKNQNVSKSTVSNIWRSHHLKPHRLKSFKLSRDARFLEKLTDVVGLYLNPPQQALVLCVDEKSQIQALDRTQPGLPLKKGRCGTMTHDYKRNGTTTLFAALEVLQGKVVGQCYKRHRQAASEASHPTFLGGAATSNGKGADSENGDDARTPPDHSRLSELKMQWISVLRVETRALFLINRPSDSGDIPLRTLHLGTICA